MKEPFVYPDWPAPGNILAFSSTRETGDHALPEALAAPEMRIPRIQQVHGALAVNADMVRDGQQADAIYSRQPGQVCRIVTADCLPILLCNRSGTEIAAIHAGWRGLVAGVIESTVAALHSGSGDLLAWIGPAICQAHYEVGGEVREAFLEAAPTPLRPDVAACFQSRGDKYLADLEGLARGRLRHLGINAIHGGGLCTYGDPGRFHSWRRDGSAAGRVASMLCILPGVS